MPRLSLPAFPIPPEDRDPLPNVPGPIATRASADLPDHHPRPPIADPDLKEKWVWPLAEVLRPGTEEAAEAQFPFLVDNIGAVEVKAQAGDMFAPTGRHNGQPRQRVAEVFHQVYRQANWGVLSAPVLLRFVVRTLGLPQ